MLHATVDAVRSSLIDLPDWGLAGTRDGQYRSDLVADAAALEILLGAGLGVLSEESGVHQADRPIVVVVDPVDGSTNASLGLPWWATSVCAVDHKGPLAAVVANQATGVRFEAVRGGGARVEATRQGGGRPVRPSACVAVGEAVIGLNDYPADHLGWRQYRAMGAAALDLCAVASGSFDGYVDCGAASLAPWDYLGGLLVCRESGAAVADANGEDLVVLDPTARRAVVAAGTPELLRDLLEARRRAGAEKIV